MSDDVKSKDESVQNQDLTNIKAEMDRKLGNTEAQLQELKSTNEQLLQQLQSLTQAQQVQAQQAQQSQRNQETEDLSQLIYDNPQKYADIIQQRAEERVMKKVQASQAEQQKQTTVISQLMADYPELSDANNDLTRKAVEIYNSFPEDERSNPLSYKVAVRDAAAELEIKPRSKRSKEESDSFTMSSGSGSGERRTEATDEQTVLKIAQAFGMNTSDEKVKERLKKRAERKNWTKYQ